jgi:multidrug resistance protein MdtO
VFVFPYIDSITSLVAIVAGVAFISAWIAAGRTFSYVGTQIAFSFYIVAFEGFSAPTQLDPSRDRLIGILVALVLIWFVFDQLWLVRTVTAMRHSLASMLRQHAALLRLPEETEDPADRLRTADALRSNVAKTVAGLRTMDDTVLYEFGANIVEHRRSGDMIVAALRGRENRLREDRHAYDRRRRTVGESSLWRIRA